MGREDLFKRWMLRQRWGEAENFKEEICNHWDEAGLEKMFNKLIWWSDKIGQIMGSVGEERHAAGLSSVRKSHQLSDLGEQEYFRVMEVAKKAWDEREEPVIPPSVIV